MCRSGFLTLISCMQSKSGAFRLGIHFSVQLDTALQLMRPYRSKKSKDAAFNTQLMNYGTDKLNGGCHQNLSMCTSARVRVCVRACVCIVVLLLCTLNLASTLVSLMHSFVVQMISHTVPLGMLTSEAAQQTLAKSVSAVPISLVTDH